MEVVNAVGKRKTAVARVYLKKGPNQTGASIGIGQSTRLHTCSNIDLKSKD